MPDWLWSGLLGGLFGKDIVTFLSRFRLRIVFILGVFAVELFLFLNGVRFGGVKFAWHRMLEVALTPVGILGPIGIGVLCVLVMVLCAPDLIGKSKDDKPKEHEPKKKKKT